MDDAEARQIVLDMPRRRVETIVRGDCLDVLRTIPSRYVDAVITDPPGAISIMNEDWDGDRGGRQVWIDWLALRFSECLRVSKISSYALVWSHPKTSHWTGIALEDAGWTVVDTIEHVMGNGYPKSNGHGLKPAHEVWWLVRNGAEKILDLNLDECRVQPSGRMPSNLVMTHSVDCGDEACARGCPVFELDQQSGETVSKIGKPRSLKAGNGWRMTKTGTEYSDRGGASRFFPRFRYCARATRAERDGGLGFRSNEHPTVKPLDLMRWFVRLVTPKPGCVLDPFLGSGTTAVAAKMEGRRIIGIEERADYANLSRQRYRRADA